MPRANRTITDVVNDIMAQLPDTEEVIAHGRPSFKVGGRTFAVYTINHHGDGRVALLVVAPKGAQAMFTQMDPECYFVPAYVGPKGWLGINLDQGLDWSTVCEHVCDAWEKVAPAHLADSLDREFTVKPPTRRFRPEEIDPFQGKHAKAVLKKLEAICASLPESEPGEQFGCPVWKAGKKTYVTAHFREERLKISVWVGTEHQSELVEDERFTVAMYTGHNGWIDLDVEEQQDWEEIRDLVLDSYRHFALKRMLKALEEKN